MSHVFSETPVRRNVSERWTSQVRLWMRLLLAAMVMNAGWGCSKSKYETTPVQGIVLCHGKPVSGGNLVFSPIPTGEDSQPGKPAAAVVGEDGKFQLATYSPTDGAIIGRHRVMYSMPDGRPGMTPCGAMVVQEIEIVEGIADVTVELGQK